MPETFVMKMFYKINGNQWRNQQGVPPPPFRIVKIKLNNTPFGGGHASLN